MTESNNKRLPGIPDRTLAFIADSAGGTIEKFITEDNKTHVRLTIGSHVLESDTNTRLLIQVLSILDTRTQHEKNVAIAAKLESQSKVKPPVWEN